MTDWHWLHAKFIGLMAKQCLSRCKQLLGRCPDGWSIHCTIFERELSCSLVAVVETHCWLVFVRSTSFFSIQLQGSIFILSSFHCNKYFINAFYSIMVRLDLTTLLYWQSPRPSNASQAASSPIPISQQRLLASKKVKDEPSHSCSPSSNSSYSWRR